jgi:hypothetical protein
MTGQSENIDESRNNQVKTAWDRLVSSVTTRVNAEIAAGNTIDEISDDQLYNQVVEFVKKLNEDK